MDIKLSKEAVEAITVDSLSDVGLDMSAYVHWRAAGVTLSISKLTMDLSMKLLNTLTKHQEVRTVKAAMRVVTAWVGVLANPEAQTCKAAAHSFALLKSYIATSPGKRVYIPRDDDAYDAYYVGRLAYASKSKNRDGTWNEGYVSVKLYYIELGATTTRTIHFGEDYMHGRTAAMVLDGRNILLETDSLRAEYLNTLSSYKRIVDNIGGQYLARGYGTTDLDNMMVLDKDSRNDYRYYSRKVPMMFEGKPSKVVIDVLSEEKPDENVVKGEKPPSDFWDSAVGVDEEEIVSDDIDVPVHFTVPVFVLRTQQRVSVDAALLVPYEHDASLSDKLILPAVTKEFVDVLLSNKGSFTDIIGGKSGGSIILCSGKPGTGKTLTAEVYAEARGKPLYSVQASQLGTDVESLEALLKVVFARAVRWGAILLIDEADVYIHERGSDLHQNAIVGVILRLLEYYQGIMFMTTNRVDLIDDAVSSRCLAKITYEYPTKEDQEKIWKVLSASAGVEVSDDDIRRIVVSNPQISGRDVKNLLKLGIMVSSATGKPITADTIEFVKRFKPTA